MAAQVLLEAFDDGQRVLEQIALQLFDASLLALCCHGMNAEEVLTIVRNGLGGEPVSVLLDGVKRFDIGGREVLKIHG